MSIITTSTQVKLKVTTMHEQELTDWLTMPHVKEVKIESHCWQHYCNGACHVMATHPIF